MKVRGEITIMIGGIRETPIDEIMEIPIDGIMETPIDGIMETPIDGIIEVEIGKVNEIANDHMQRMRAIGTLPKIDLIGSPQKLSTSEQRKEDARNVEKRVISRTIAGAPHID